MSENELKYGDEVVIPWGFTERHLATREHRLANVPSTAAGFLGVDWGEGSMAGARSGRAEYRSRCF